MAGTVMKRKNGSFQVIQDLPPQPGGPKRPRRYATFKRERDAKRQLAEWEAELASGVVVVKDRQTVGDYLIWWLDTCKVHEVRDNTLADYRWRAEKYLIPRFGKVQLSKLTPMQVQTWVSQCKQRGLSGNTIDDCYGLLRRALRHAVKLNLIARNPTDGVSLPHCEHREPTVWQLEDIQRFLDSIPDHKLYPLWLTALVTGLRRGELVGLRWQDVDLEKRILCVRQSIVLAHGRKSKHTTKSPAGERVIDLGKTMVAVLREHRLKQMELRLAAGALWSDYDLVFPTDRGTAYHPDNISHQFAELIDGAGLPHIRLHDLRHTAATLMAVAGVSELVASERMGHSDPNLTRAIYQHTWREQHRDAAERVEEVVFGKRREA
jgi:integrase